MIVFKMTKQKSFVELR